MEDDAPVIYGLEFQVHMAAVTPFIIIYLNSDILFVS